MPYVNELYSKATSVDIHIRMYMFIDHIYIYLHVQSRFLEYIYIYGNIQMIQKKRK